MNKLLRKIFNWCDWCETLCIRPTYLELTQETVCRHCIEEACDCEVCDELIHADCSVDMPEGWYCQDCWDSVYG